MCFDNELFHPRSSEGRKVISPVNWGLGIIAPLLVHNPRGPFINSLVKEDESAYFGRSDKGIHKSDNWTVKECESSRETRFAFVTARPLAVHLPLNFSSFNYDDFYPKSKLAFSVFLNSFVFPLEPSLINLDFSQVNFVPIIDKWMAGFICSEWALCVYLLLLRRHFFLSLRCELLWRRWESLTWVCLLSIAPSFLLLLLLRRGGKRVSPEAVFRAKFQTEICLNLKSFDFWTDSSGVRLGCVIFGSVFAPFQTHRANIDSARNRRLGPPLEMTQFIPLL